MFQPSRDEARRFFFDTWAKFQRGDSLSALEAMALGVINRHPEYHALLTNPELNLDRDYGPESGQTNPFLHLSLHMAIEEQLSIDQPRGIREHFQHILEKTGDEHEARHAVLECLGETIWQAQRAGKPLDEAGYLDCLRRKAGEGPGARD